jgi:hypothetical protein
MIINQLSGGAEVDSTVIMADDEIRSGAYCFGGGARAKLSVSLASEHGMQKQITSLHGSIALACCIKDVVKTLKNKQKISKYYSKNIHNICKTYQNLGVQCLRNKLFMKAYGDTTPSCRTRNMHIVIFVKCLDGYTFK